MHLLWCVWLLAGMLSGLATAELKANMNIWNIDSSCTHYPEGKAGGTSKMDDLQAAFNEALTVCEAAMTAIQFVQKKRPSDKDGYLKWTRIAEAIAVTQGWYPDPNDEDDPTHPYWERLLTLYQRAYKALQAAHNDPPYGYSPALYRLPDARPLLVCGDGRWQWLDLEDPVLPTNIKLKNYPDFKEYVKEGAVGAWFLPGQGRMNPAFNKNKEIYCAKDRYARVWFNENAVVVCEATDEFKGNPSLKAVKEGNIIKEGDDLDTYTRGLGFTILHEMMHWFGGVKKKSDGSYDPSENIIVDKQAVDQWGNVLYSDNKNPTKRRTADSPLNMAELKSSDWSIIYTYGSELVWNLAVDHELGNSGPTETTDCAESLAYLATMLYLDKWNWAYRGKASKLGPLKN